MATALAQAQAALGTRAGIINQNAQKRELKGAERVAVLLLALGDKYGMPIWSKLDELELKEISQAMATMGALTTEMIEEVLVDFVTRVTSNQSMAGGFETTERLLASFMDADKVTSIMEEIRGPAGRNMWEKLSNVQENVLANYLKNEYPQTTAVVLSKIRSDHAAKVLSLFPDELALEVINRMLKMESVQKDILEKVEQTLRVEFMSNLSHTRRRDSHEMMAEIFNNFDRQTEARFLTALEEDARDSAERIKALMFTFEDLGRMDAASCQTVLRQFDPAKLTIALKGASETLRDFFFGNMSSRQAQNVREEMEVMGPVRLREVDEAQMAMVNLAKDLAAKGEIILSKSKGDDEVVF
ncbi:MAG: flagellar motor switch protein FliG [Hyphomicrobiaceae bacterium]|nr:flagellar motor switch protein FliG [Hyphomicrobiaceae bacterium]